MTTRGGPAGVRLPLHLIGITTVLAAVAFGCTGSSGSGGSDRPIVTHADFPVALTPDADGGLLYAERLTGRVRHVTRRGRLEHRAIARVTVSTGGQRGLLGVARDPAGRIFAAFTSPHSGEPIEVAQLVPTFRLVWSGPASSKLANGGHLVYDPNRRRIIIGIGDLGERRKRSDPDAPNGKLLLLDPDGAPTQRATILSHGWNNPFAFTLTPSGDLWVADNVPGQTGERLARGDLGDHPSHVTNLPTNTVPSGVAALSNHTLVVCSFAEGRSLRYVLRAGGAARIDGFGDGARCRTGIAAQAGTRALWLASERSIHELSPR